MAVGLPISRGTCGEGGCGMGMGGLQRGWLAAAASRARPLEGDEKVLLPTCLLSGTGHQPRPKHLTPVRCLGLG